MSNTVFKNNIITTGRIRRSKEDLDIQNDEINQIKSSSIQKNYLISQESQFTDNYLISDRELQGESSLNNHRQSSNNRNNNHNNIKNIGDNKYNIFRKSDQNQQQNEDYTNILEQQISYNSNQQINPIRNKKSSQQIAEDLMRVDEEQIDIIEDDDEDDHYYNPNNFQNNNNNQNNQQNDNYNNININLNNNYNNLQFAKMNQEKNNNIQNNKDIVNNLIGNQQSTPSNNNYQNGGVIQLGEIQKGKLKDEEQQNGTIKNNGRNHSDSFSRVQTMSNGHYTNGQRLWSVVRRDIFYPIKFSGKVEIGLVKKQKNKFRGSQSQIIQSQDPLLFIHPHGLFKLFWDLFIGLITLYYPIFMPIRICFGLSSRPYIPYDVILDFIYIIDMFFSCITGINQGGEIIKNRFYITTKYLRAYFLWDLISAIPYYTFENEFSQIKIFRFARYWDRYLLLLNKTIYYLFKGGTSHKFAVLFYYLFKVSSLILICVHVMTCWWIQVGTMEEYGDSYETPERFIQTGWVTRYYDQYPNKPQYGSVSKDIYINGYYYVTTTIATVGYGDVSSKTVMESFYTMFCEFFGIALFGYISGGLVSAVQISLLVGTMKQSKKKSEYDQWLYQREKNKQYPLFSTLLKNLRAINEFNSDNNFSDFFSEVELFHYLPKEQKRKVFNLIFTDIATFFGAFFRNISELSMIQDIFQYMHPLTFLPGGEVIKYKNSSRGIYFIVSGKVYIKIGQDQATQNKNKTLAILEKLTHQKTNKKQNNIFKDHFRKLKAGSFFGEFCLLDKNSAFSFIAGGKKPLNTLFITKQKLMDICMKYKETYSWLKKFTYYRFKYFKMEKYNFLKKVNIFSQDNTGKNGNGQKKSQFSKLKNLFNRRKKSLINKQQNDKQLPSEEVDDQQSQITEKMSAENIQTELELQNNLSSSNNNNFLDNPIIINDILNTNNNNDLSLQDNINQQELIPNIQKQSSSNNNTIQLNKKSSKSNNNIIQQQPDLLEQIQQNQEQMSIKNLMSEEIKKRGTKSDLEFFLEKGHDFFYAQKIKSHIRQKSCQDSFKFNNNNQRSSQNFDQQNLQQNNINNNKLNSNKRCTSETANNFKKQRYNYKSFEQENSILKQTNENENMKHQRHHKHLSLNNNNGNKNQFEQSNKERHNKLSSNFQSMYLNEFSQDQNNNNKNNNESDQNNRDSNISEQNNNNNNNNNINGILIQQQMNVNYPYQFNVHVTRETINNLALSPQSKENDKLITTPFSSNQQTHTRDTINNQKLLFSDDDQNSFKGHNLQLNYIQGRIGDRQDELKSQENESFHSCIIEMDTDLDDNQHNNNSSRKKQQNQQQLLFDDNNNRSKKTTKSIQFDQLFNEQNINKNNIHRGSQSVTDIKNQIDFSQFVQNTKQRDQYNGLFISILEKNEENDDNNLNNNNNDGNNNSNNNANLNNIQQEGHQPIYAIDEIDEEHVNDHLSDNQFQTNNKNKGNNIEDNTNDLIKFETSENLSQNNDNENDYDENYNESDINTIDEQYQIQQQKTQNQQILSEIFGMNQESLKDQQQKQSNQEPSLQSKQSNSNNHSDDSMNSEEERIQQNKIESKQLNMLRNDSVQKIMLINVEEKKIRRAFRYVTTSNNIQEMKQTKKQFKIAQQVGIKMPFIKQLSQSRLKKQTQHKVMKKILNKKIQILVDTVLEKQQSGYFMSERIQQRNNNNNNLGLNSLHHDLLPIKSFSTKQQQMHKTQFECIMNNSNSIRYNPINNKINNNNQVSPINFEQDEQPFGFNQAVSIRSSIINNNNNNGINDMKQCSSEYQSISPSNNQLFSKHTIHSNAPSPINQPQNTSFQQNQKQQMFQLDQQQQFLSIQQQQQQQQLSPFQQSRNSAIPKSKFSKKQIDNINRSPEFGSLNNTNNQNEFKLDDNNKEEQEDSNDRTQTKIKDMLNEDDNESYQDDSSNDEKQNDSADNIEKQMNQIYTSRVPNFQLLLYIENLVKKHNQEYKFGAEQFDQDDYQCYEEIECYERNQNGNAQSVNSALDSSIDIPIDIIKPNFDATEIFSLPGYLESQISILDNKVQSIVEQTYEDCYSCLEKIKKLAKNKEKRYLFSGMKDETDTNINIDNLSHKPNKESLLQPKISQSNIISTSQFNPSQIQQQQQQQITNNNIQNHSSFVQQQQQQQQDQLNNNQINSLNQFNTNQALPNNNTNLNNTINNNTNNVVVQNNNNSNINNNSNSVNNSGVVNLGHNIQFALPISKNNTQKEEYNFFTELEKKNQIMLNNKNSLYSEYDPFESQIKQRMISPYSKTNNNGIQQLKNNNEGRFSDLISQNKSNNNNQSSKDDGQNNINSLQQQNQQQQQSNSNQQNQQQQQQQQPQQYLLKNKIMDLKVSITQQQQQQQQYNNLQNISEQQRIKNEFKKMFSNMRSHIGDSSPSRADFSETSSNNMSQM